MNLIIIEGEKRKSEYQFWDNAIKYRYNNVELYALNGVQNLKVCLTSIVGLKKYEHILILIDTTAVYNRVKDITNIVSKIVLYTHIFRIPVDIQMLKYYCFEDCLLYFKHICTWLYSPVLRYGLNKSSNSWKSINTVFQSYLALGLHNSLSSSDDYVWTKNEILNKYVVSKIPAGVGVLRRSISREKISSWILTDLTKGSNFRVTKSYLSNCWMCSCKDKDKCTLCLRLKSIPKGQLIKAREGIKCGLWENKKSINDKTTEIFKYSLVLKQLNGISWL